MAKKEGALLTPMLTGQELLPIKSMGEQSSFALLEAAKEVFDELPP